MFPTRLLLIDDEEGFVDTLAKRLQTKGYEVRTALSGKAGLDILQKGFAADVVLLDVKMPGMDGVEVLHRIKEIQPLIEVIMLTGHATVETAVQGMKEGAFDYLMKPSEFKELTAKLDDAAALKRLHEQKIDEIRQQPYLSPQEQEDKVRAVVDEALKGRMRGE